MLTKSARDAQFEDTIQYTAYGFLVATALPFEVAIQRMTTALKTYGFGVLTTIDVKATLKEKLDVEWPDYVILGACNPPLAHQALSKEWELGLLLPCNVIVYRTDDGRCMVGAVDPEKMMEMVDNPALARIARAASDRLRAALLLCE